jgi:hypothetical protein
VKKTPIESLVSAASRYSRAKHNVRPQPETASPKAEAAKKEDSLAVKK